MAKLKSLLSVYLVGRLINHLSTVSMDSLYSTLKVGTKPFDINQKRLCFNWKNWETLIKRKFEQFDESWPNGQTKSIQY